jgi:hypothetical protein
MLTAMYLYGTANGFCRALYNPHENYNGYIRFHCAFSFNVVVDYHSQIRLTLLSKNGRKEYKMG